MFHRSTLLCSLLAVGATLAALPVFANERHFTNSYESAVLPPGVVEIEPWATARLGKDRYFSRIDNRLEFEVGLTERLQTSLYINWGSVGARDGDGIIQSAPNHRGISSEWKYKLTDSVADAIGSALYLELGLNDHEMEVETKIILDKRVGAWNVAFNGVYEFEHKFQAGDAEHKVAATFGLGYFLSNNLSLGLEAYAMNVFAAEAHDGGAEETKLMHGAVFAGPVLSYALRNWWVAASVTPQVMGYGHELAEGRGLNLDEFERVQGRVIMGIHL